MANSELKLFSSRHFCGREARDKHKVQHSQSLSIHESVWFPDLSELNELRVSLGALIDILLCRQRQLHPPANEQAKVASAQLGPAKAGRRNA
jgi:hypothetical protein